MPQDISIFDIVSIALILILAIKGVINGFIKEVAGLVGLVGGIFIASRYAHVAGAFIDTNIYKIQNAASLYIVGFIVTLIGFWILSLFIGFIITHMLKISALGGLDKIAGFFVGGSKIFFMFSILVATLSHIEFVKTKMDSVMEKSFVYPVFLEVGEYILKEAPKPTLQE
ncbi:MAG: CvpA family protein [Sulfurospirillum sp.]|nr:CvpA family protein [Sulfurospirillum sp.]